MKGLIESIFHHVVDLTVEARIAYYDEHGIDASIRREVEALCVFDSGASRSLEWSVGQAAQGALDQYDKQEIQCGPYQLKDLLGRGGMGTVHLAERVDGEVAQRVAVKLLRPGADDPPVRQRFLAERQILATLSHPNIARLLDAGHRNDGQPYLVMEYVEGKAIDEYTDSFSIRQKVALFIKVCAAVGYLHRNLVVHRDLKPSNILVTAEGEPKILDFGIAKMLDWDSDATITSMRMLTPDYASPEQAVGTPVTTATDVYSLGAVLYRLLTGVSPHRFDNDSGPAVVAAILAGRIEPPSRLSPALRGDLELILLKCLRREPQERYATVEQFSDDLESFLESRPIRARKGDAWYHTRKFLRRYWLPVAASTLAAAGLTTGVLVANHQRAVAQQRFELVRGLANKLFDIDAEVRLTPGTTKARQMIVETALSYLQKLATDVHRDPELGLEMGNAYWRVARVQGIPIANNLGQLEPAAKSLETARQLIQGVLSSQPSNRIAILRAAQIEHDRMLLARNTGRNADALAAAKLSGKYLAKINASKTDEPAERGPLLITYFNVADQHMLMAEYQEALQLADHGTQIAEIFGAKPYVGMFKEIAAQVFRRQGKLDEALPQIRTAVSALDSNPPPTEQARVMNLALALILEGCILGEDGRINMGRPEEALAPLTRALAIADKFAHGDSKDQNSRGRLAFAGVTMAGILRHSDALRSLEVYDHVLQHTAEIKNNASIRKFEISALAGSSYALLKLGRAPEAKQRLDEAFARLRDLKMYPAKEIQPGSQLDETLSALANLEVSKNNLPRAIEIYHELLDKMPRSEPDPKVNLEEAVHLSRVYTRLVALERRARQNPDAEALHARQVDLWRHWDTQLPKNPFIQRQLNDAMH